MAMAMATTAIDDHAIHREGYAKSIRASSFAVVSGHQFLSGLNEASQPVFALLAGAAGFGTSAEVGNAAQRARLPLAPRRSRAGSAPQAASSGRKDRVV
jgi:hypothetical protein